MKPIYFLFLILVAGLAFVTLGSVAWAQGGVTRADGSGKIAHPQTYAPPSQVRRGGGRDGTTGGGNAAASSGSDAGAANRAAAGAAINAIAIPLAIDSFSRLNARGPMLKQEQDRVNREKPAEGLAHGLIDPMLENKGNVRPAQTQPHIDYPGTEGDEYAGHGRAQPIVENKGAPATKKQICHDYSTGKQVEIDKGQVFYRARINREIEPRLATEVRSIKEDPLPESKKNCGYWGLGRVTCACEAERYKYHVERVFRFAEQERQKKADILSPGQGSGPSKGDRKSIDPREDNEYPCDNVDFRSQFGNQCGN